MKKLLRYIRKHPLHVLILTIPLAILAKFGGWGAGWVFGLSAAGVIPLAGLIGEATENLAVHTGPRIGGLINATLGNAAELIITLFAIQAGLLELVKASITGSIIGNLLFVLGLSILLGGLKHGIQQFDRRHTVNSTILLAIALIGLTTPSLFSNSTAVDLPGKVEVLSLCVAGVMILLYALGIIFSLKKMPSSGIGTPPELDKAEKAGWTIPRSLLVLALATGGVKRAVGRQRGSSGSREWFVGILPGHHPGANYRQYSRAPGCRPDGAQEQDGVEHGDRRILQPTNRVVLRPVFGFHQPLDGESLNTGVQHIRAGRTAGSRPGLLLCFS
jgi:Ca2+/H+ antiporter